MKVLVLVLMALVSLTGQGLAKPRVGYANVARDPAAGQAAVARAREAVAKKGTLEELDEGPRRDMLEGPLSGQSAEMVVGRARSLVDKAREAAVGFEYDTALDDLRQAEQVLRPVAPSPAVIQTLAEINLREGVVHAERGDKVRAAESFRMVARLDPARTKLQPAAFRPQVVQLYAQAVAQAMPPGVLVIKSEPEGATVWLDGKPAGQTPLTIPSVASGDHYVALTIDGYETRTEIPHVHAGKSQGLTGLLLTRLPAEERTRALRAGLLREGTSEADVARAAAALADTAAVDVLLVVREDDAAVYDVRSARLGAWIKVADGAALAAALPLAGPATLSAAPPSEVALRLDQRAPPREPPRPKKWYKTWWAYAAYTGVAVVALGAVAWAVVPEPEKVFAPQWTPNDMP